MRTVAEFMAKVEKTAGCWLWTGATSKSSDAFHYGSVTWQEKPTRPHRVSYEIHVGAIPDGLVIDHLCRNTLCVNPDHLEAVTQRENVLRGTSPAARQAQQTHCKRGHSLSDPEHVWIRSNGGRQCRTCARARKRKWVAANHAHVMAYRRERYAAGLNA